MLRTSRAAAPLLLVSVLLAGCRSEYDLVITGGRVMDPATGLDGVRNIAVAAGRIVLVTEGPVTGAREIDATGLVVAPGFVDLHEHGQTDEAYRLMVRDGVTSAFELEVGTGDVEAWYAERAGGQLVNYGVSIGHIPVRMRVMDDPGDFLPAGAANHTPATDEQIAQMEELLRAGLDEGAVAVGFGPAYTPAATRDELTRMFRIAADRGASAHIHVRGALTGLQEAIEIAGETGAALHVVHANSSGGARTAEFLELIAAARSNGQDVTTEAYPYGAGMTRIESALFDDWETWDDDQFRNYQWVATGERLTRDTFGRYREATGAVIIHSRTEEMTREAIGNPLTMIASDGFIEDGVGHPRTSGTYAKVLGRYVREEGLVDLMDALRRMTIEPARRLEPYVPSMAAKGRLAPGADADITVFNPATVIDRSTYMDATIPSAGIPYVIVNGDVVVDDGEVTDARPGRAVRR